jgi:hypothetical protein
LLSCSGLSERAAQNGHAGAHAQAPPSHSWASHADESPTQLSATAEDGLEYARDLAYDAEERVRQARRGDPLTPPLTIADLSKRDGISEATIRARIRLARRQLFGELSDSGIRKRLQRQRIAAARAPRPCQQHDCRQPLPQNARSNRRNCNLHASPKERTRRHRKTRSDHPTPDD